MKIKGFCVRDPTPAGDQSFHHRPTRTAISGGKPPEVKETLDPQFQPQDRQATRDASPSLSLQPGLREDVYYRTDPFSLPPKDPAIHHDNLRIAVARIELDLNLQRIDTPKRNREDLG